MLDYAVAKFIQTEDTANGRSSLIGGVNHSSTPCFSQAKKISFEEAPLQTKKTAKSDEQWEDTCALVIECAIRTLRKHESLKLKNNQSGEEEKEEVLSAFEEDDRAKPQPPMTQVVKQICNILDSNTVILQSERAGVS